MSDAAAPRTRADGGQAPTPAAAAWAEGRSTALPAATRLRDLQLSLQHHLFGEPSDVAEAIVAAPPLSVERRLAIYHNAYRVRLIEALDDTYPRLHAVLGDETFCALGEAFLAEHPSVHRSIRWFGRELPEYLRHHEPFAAQPILAELAMLEWTLAEVFDSPDAVPLERAALAAVPPADWAGLGLTLHPSVRRLALEWNSVPVWQALGADRDAPEPLAAERPMPWLLWRRGLENYFRSMAPDEAAALNAARAGATFGEICEIIAAHQLEEGAETQAAMRAAGLIGAWADAGLLVGLTQTG